MRLIRPDLYSTLSLPFISDNINFCFKTNINFCYDCNGVQSSPFGYTV